MFTVGYVLVGNPRGSESSVSSGCSRRCRKLSKVRKLSKQSKFRKPRKFRKLRKAVAVPNTCAERRAGHDAHERPAGEIAHIL